MNKLFQRQAHKILAIRTIKFRHALNTIGWIGSALLIAAYFLNSKNYFTAQSFWYQTMNVIGSIFLAVNTIYFGAYPSSVVNIIWTFIAFYYLNQIRKAKKETI